VIGAQIDKVIDGLHIQCQALIDVGGEDGVSVDDWSGRLIATLSAVSTETIPYTFYDVNAFDAATGIFTLDRTTGLEKGMVFVICTKGVDNSDDPTTVTDPGLSNASNYKIVSGVIVPTPHSGLEIGKEEGGICRVLGGKSRGMSSPILDNGAISLALANEIPMDETSVWVIHAPTPLFVSDSDPLINPDRRAVMTIKTADSFNSQAMLLMGLTIDVFGNISGQVDAPVRMVYVWGQARLLTETGHIVIGLDDDTITQGPTGDGVGATGKNGNIHETGRPFTGSISCRVVPTTADAVFDILVSSDGGATWTSIFPVGTEADPMKYMMRFPMSAPDDPQRVNWTTFRNITLTKDTDIVRVDVKQSGGALDIEIVVKYGTAGVAN
jgi:hypothetical protein